MSGVLEAIHRFAIALGAEASIAGFSVTLPAPLFDQLTADAESMRKYLPKPSYQGVVDKSGEMVGAMAEIKVWTSIGVVTVRRERMIDLR